MLTIRTRKGRRVFRSRRRTTSEQALPLAAERKEEMMETRTALRAALLLVAIAGLVMGATILVNV